MVALRRPWWERLTTQLLVGLLWPCPWLLLLEVWRKPLSPDWSRCTRGMSSTTPMRLLTVCWHHWSLSRDAAHLLSTLASPFSLEVSHSSFPQADLWSHVRPCHQLVVPPCQHLWGAHGRCVKPVVKCGWGGKCHAMALQMTIKSCSEKWCRHFRLRELVVPFVIAFGTIGNLVGSKNVG